MADCAIFILWNGNEALMENRPDLGPGVYPYWVYPGGKVGQDEEREAAMLRKCFEEAHVAPFKWSLLTDEELWSSPNHHSNPDDKRGWRVYAYVVSKWAGNVPDESFDHQHATYAWIDPTELATDEPDEFTCRAAIARHLLALSSVTGSHNDEARTAK